MGRVKRIWYLSPMRAAKVQASLRIRAVSPEPSLLAHTSSESRGTFRQKARSLASLNGWACAVKICHDGMLEDTNSLDGAQILNIRKHITPQGQRNNTINLIKPDDHWSCIAHLSAEDMLKSADTEERKLKTIISEWFVPRSMNDLDHWYS